MTTTYKIGEAATLLNLKTYVLRFWETEFPEIVPLRTEKGQRLYTEEHLALLERIRYLLHDRGLTIEGARKTLAEERSRGLTYVFGALSGVELPDNRDGLVLDPEEPEDAAAEPGREPDAGGGVNTMGAAPFGRIAALSGRRMSNAGAALQTPFLASLAQAGLKPRSQYNLPGLDQVVALRAALAAEKLEAEAKSAGEDAAAEFPGAGKMGQGMLPLFAVVRSAFLAGKAAGASLPSKGGDNFIQPVPEAPKPVAPAIPALSPVPPIAGPSARETLRSIADELESVADMLRAAPVPHDDTSKPS